MQFKLYSKDDCGFCNKARSLLTIKSLPFKEFKLGKDYTRDELLERFPQAKTFPQVELETKGGILYIGGHDELVKFVAENLSE